MKKNRFPTEGVQTMRALGCFAVESFCYSFELHSNISLYGKVQQTDGRLAPASRQVPPPCRLHEVSFYIARSHWSIILKKCCFLRERIQGLGGA